MRRIGSTNTTPEIVVRRFLHSRGYRFRLHRKDLPGTPDIVLPRYRVAILVHGCFWHRHSDCHLAYVPRTRTEFWASKFEANVSRDRRTREALHAAGWSVLTVWECQTRRHDLDWLPSAIELYGKR